MGDSQGKELHICIVDDDPEMLEISCSRLRSKGYTRIICCSSGTAAMKLLPHANLNAVVSDIEMGEVSGHDLFNAVRGAKEYDAVKFIVVSGTVPPLRWTEKADSFLPKPLDYEKLHDLFDSYTQSKSGGEKRLYKRAGCHDEVTVAPDNSVFDSLRNASLSGICFESRKEYSEGDKLSFRIKSWGAKELAPVSGKVVWKRWEKGTWVYGVHFEQPLLPAE